MTRRTAADSQNPATTDCIRADFRIDPGTGPDDVTLEQESGAPQITLDAAGDIHVYWPESCFRAELRVDIVPERDVEFDGLSLGLRREALPTGASLPITAGCEVDLPRRSLVLYIDRASWTDGSFPIYSVLFEFRAVNSEKSWLHDPKVYNEGPDGTGTSASG